jgi:hypothetical protein
MTVKELINRLKDEDPDMRVVVDGYESGFDEFEKMFQVFMKPNPRKNDPEKDDKWWEGEFKETTDDEATEIALLLPRKS